ncbi:MAG: hypothetical protein KIG88_00785 [Weeksellaceae bacterium]|nr:hypothetical protein [Weeksellaceae bacterium]
MSVFIIESLIDYYDAFLKRVQNDKMEVIAGIDYFVMDASLKSRRYEILW